MKEFTRRVGHFPKSESGFEAFCHGMCESLSQTVQAERNDFEQASPTPYLAHDDKDYDDDNEPKGQLQSIAAKVIMNILYGARMARYDLLHSCQI